MTEKEIFTIALNLDSAWIIENVEFKDSCLYISIKYNQNTAKCPLCKKEFVVDKMEEKTFRHLNFFQHKCFITSTVPKFKCNEHGIQELLCPWERKELGFICIK